MTTDYHSLYRQRIEATAAHRHKTLPRDERNPITTEQIDRAVALAVDLATTAERHGVTVAETDGVMNIAIDALDAIRSADRAGNSPAPSAPNPASQVLADWRAGVTRPDHDRDGPGIE